MKNINIAVIGLGYVGLPLAVEFAKKYKTVGFDINYDRIKDLKKGIDNTLEIDCNLLRSLFDDGLFSVSTNIDEIIDCNVYIITVPTPTDKYNRPNLKPLIDASELVGSVLKKGDFVIYESTVYPGVTEEECVPILKQVSGLLYNVDFFAGYSPERINPGDKLHNLTSIIKVTSGSTPEAADFVDKLYDSIILAGTHRAPSIKVAEAAKVIENSQRDINIAFVNELSKIFRLMGIDTNEVLDAACTKWNFLNFRPGLVGGHCIGVDPYYLAHKAQEVGYHPEIILAGRRTNDEMGKYVAKETIKEMIRKELPLTGARVLILGFTFKENCPDVRNTRVIDVYLELKSYNLEVEIYDPLANKKEVKEEYGLTLLDDKISILYNTYSAIILAVGHNEFKSLDFCSSDKQVVFDVKGFLAKEIIDQRL